MSITKADKITFISSADSNYFPILREWVHSIRSFPESKDIDICIMNAGMSAEQLDILRPHVTKIIEAEWPCEIAEKKTKGKEYLKACVARPWIPDYFPEYDIYFWMDADTWVQSWDAIEMFIKGAKRNKITLTGQVDRAYPKQARVKWIGRWPWKVRNFYFSNARKAFNFKTAKILLPNHVLLAGAFAMHKDAPHWKKWQDLVRHAVKKGKVFTAEQTSLGVLSYIEGYEFEILPSYIHWLCEFKPFWDKNKNKFVEPYLPHNEIGILHISGWDEMRLDRSVKTDFKIIDNDVIDGSTIDLSYRYQGFDGEE